MHAVVQQHAENGLDFKSMKMLTRKNLLKRVAEVYNLTTLAPKIYKINRIQGKSMLENKKLSDREILYQFLRRIPISNRTIAYDIVDRDSNEKQDRKQVTTS